MFRFFPGLVPLAALLAGAACAADAPPNEPLAVTGAFLFAPITPAQAGGYLTLHNRGMHSDTLVGVTADWAVEGMIHRTIEEEGRVRMMHLDRLAVPARDSVVLRPGGLHLMLLHLARLPAAGDTVEWTLHFASGATIQVTAPVHPYGREP